jgi:hypothetical protein
MSLALYLSRVRSNEVLGVTGIYLWKVGREIWHPEKLQFDFTWVLVRSIRDRSDFLQYCPGGSSHLNLKRRLSAKAIFRFQTRANFGLDLRICRGRHKAAKCDTHRRVAMLKLTPADQFGVTINLKRSSHRFVTPNG